MFCTNALTMFKELPGWLVGRFSGRRTVTFLRHRSALGDTIMVTPLARGLKVVDPELRVAVVSRRPEIFAHNPNVDENRGWHLWRSGYTVQAGYHRTDLSGTKHAVEIQWRSLWRELAEDGFPEAGGDTPPIPDGIRPEIHLTEAEREAGRRLAESVGDPAMPLILVGSGGKLKPTHNREWGQGNYQAVVDALAPHARLMQIGGERPLLAAGKPLPDYGRLPVREAAALFAACDAMLVQEGGLMHLGRAVNAPAVVIYGGYVLPRQKGYEEQTNLWSQPECSPCILAPENCPHLKCMIGISPRRILRCIRELIPEPGREILPVAILENASDAWTPPGFVDQEALRAELARGVS